jgi:hypothetical protein
MVWVYRGWHTVNKIDNGDNPFTPQILGERVKSELLKGIPDKETGAKMRSELLGM